MGRNQNRTRPRARRPARTPIQGLRATLGNLVCTVANVSTTGAMLQSRLEVAIGREVQLTLELTPHPISTRVRIMRCAQVDVALPGDAVWRRQDYTLGVMFLDRSTELTAAVRGLTKHTVGIEYSEPRILLLGKQDDISTLVEQALRDADYNPHVVTQARYALSTAKRIGAKAVVVNLEIDPKVSVQAVIDMLRSDPATAQLPIILCARQTGLQPTHGSDPHDTRLRLLLVPFTPEELIMTLDRAIDEGT